MPLPDLYLSLLESLRETCNLPEFPDPLPSAQMALELENGPTVTIDFNEETEFVEIFSEIGIYLPEKEGEITRRIAEANFLWTSTNGATLSIRPEVQTVYLAIQLPLNSINQTEFIHLIETFVETAHQWRQNISENTSETPSLVEENFSQESNSSIPSLPNNNIMMMA